MVNSQCPRNAIIVDGDRDLVILGFRSLLLLFLDYPNASLSLQALGVTGRGTFSEM